MDISILDIIIGCIIILQIIVFVRNLIRIFSYKQAIGNIHNYKIKHSIIPEEFIEDISVREILSNNIPERLQPIEINEEIAGEFKHNPQSSNSEDEWID